MYFRHRGRRYTWFFQRNLNLRWLSVNWRSRDNLENINLLSRLGKILLYLIIPNLIQTLFANIIFPIAQGMRCCSYVVESNWFTTNGIRLLPFCRGDPSIVNLFLNHQHYRSKTGLPIELQTNKGQSSQQRWNNWKDTSQLKPLMEAKPFRSQTTFNSTGSMNSGDDRVRNKVNRTMANQGKWYDEGRGKPWNPSYDSADRGSGHSWSGQPSSWNSSGPWQDMSNMMQCWFNNMASGGQNNPASGGGMNFGSQSFRGPESGNGMNFCAGGNNSLNPRFGGGNWRESGESMGGNYGMDRGRGRGMNASFGRGSGVSRGGRR